MSSGPLVTVVVPVRSQEAFVGECVRSAYAQNIDRLDVVLIDDGSTDETVSVAKAAAGSRLRVVSQPPLGLSAARNRGLDEVRSPYLLFLDADDRLRPRALERLLALLEAHAQTVVAYGEAQMIDEDGSLVGAPPPALLATRPSGDVVGALLEGGFIASTGAALVRVDAMRAAGRYREDLPRAQDWEMWCRLALRGRFAYAGAEVVLEKRRRADNISAVLGASPEAARPAIEAVFGNQEVTSRFSARDLARRRRRQLAHHLAIAGVECLRQGRVADARRHLRAALAQDPWRPREWLLTTCALLGRVPARLERRLK